MAAVWDAKSRAVVQALLDHHMATCGSLRPDAPITDAVIARHILTYEQLRRMSEIGGIAQDMGRHLKRIAAWCERHDFAPLHSLVVRDGERDPGEGYQRCPGTSGD